MNWLFIGNDITDYRPIFWTGDAWGFIEKAARFSEDDARTIWLVKQNNNERLITEDDAMRLDALARMIANAQVIIEVESGVVLVAESPHWLPIDVHYQEAEGEDDYETD